MYIRKGKNRSDMPVTHCEPALEQCGIPWNSCLIKNTIANIIFTYFYKKDNREIAPSFGITLRKKCSINELETYCLKENSVKDMNEVMIYSILLCQSLICNHKNI